MLFFMKDNDNDQWGGNCVVFFGNGWWFYKCYYFNLNGIYFKKQIFINIGMIWYYWENGNKWELFKLLKMMIKFK